MEPAGQLYPLSHCPVQAEEDWPVVEPYLPAAQSLQLLFPMLFWYCPLPQDLQLFNPVDGAYSPMAHCLHEVSWLFTFWNWPRGQFLQLVRFV